MILIVLMNMLIVGATRTGKSMGLIRYLLSIPGAKVILDPHCRSLAWTLLVHLVYRGVKNILVDRLTSTRALPIQFMRSATCAKEQERYDRELLDILGRRRGLDIGKMPLVEEYLLAVIGAGREANIPFVLLPNCLIAETREWHAACRSSDGWRFQRLKKTGESSFRQHVAPALRILERVCRSPAVMERSGTFDMGTYLDQGYWIICEGGASEDADRIILSTRALQAAQHGNRGCKQTITIVIDEAVNRELIGRLETQYMAELQKKRVSFIVATQSLTFLPEVTEPLLQNTQAHWWYRCSSVDTAKRGAEDLASAIYDPMAVHFREERRKMMHDGYAEVQIDERKQFQAQYREETEIITHYKPHQMQIAEMTRELMSLKVGERIVRQGGQVWKEYVELLEEPWPFPGLAERKTLEAIQRIESRSEYQSIGGPGGSQSSPAPTIPSPSATSLNSSPAARVRNRNTPPPTAP